jgi:GDPmannose 4,6-dehydratase
MKTALITGITGQDGTYLAELLAGKGYRVIGVSRSARAHATALPKDALVDADVAHREALERVILETRPDEIYHLAAQSSVGASFERPLETFESIATGTLNVLEATRRADWKPRLLVASSGEVFGDTGGTPTTETTALRPLNPYSAAKAAATHLVTSYRASFGVFASVAYFYNHESPRRPAHFVTKKIVRTACRIARGLDSSLELGDISVIRDWGWAPEYTEAAWRILSLDAPEDFVIASGESIALEEFIEVAFRRVGLRASDHVVTTRALFRSVDIPVMRADPSRAAERLGWRAKVRGAEVAEHLVDAELAALDAELARQSEA